MRRLLESAIHGYDVVPAAIHLTAATLAMAESRQLITDMPLYWMPHDVKERARLGSLDFLTDSAGKGQAHHLPMFPDATDAPQRRTGTGETKHDVFMPDCDLVIANPPYTRAGGPGSAENTAWNPIFGSVLSEADADAMQRALVRTLKNTPASTYAGLGSAFVALAHERLKAGGRLAFVLPSTVLTGSRWAGIRELLLSNYDVEWVVVSHDARHRAKRQGLPGRLYVGFSESTRTAETLLVATKRRIAAPRRTPAPVTRFVNLRHNPDEPIEAIAIARAILTKKHELPRTSHEIVVGEKAWGEIQLVPQHDLTAAPWFYSVFVQSRLARAAVGLANGIGLEFDGGAIPIQVTPLDTLAELGPYEMQVKNPKQGLFDIVETDDPARSGHPALWHHAGTAITTLRVAANARLHERPDRSSEEQRRMLARAGRLHIAREVRHAPQRLAAVCTSHRMLGVRSWMTAGLKHPDVGKEEALCLWFNSTPGLMLRLCYANRSYLGRHSLPHELMRLLPVLNVDALSQDQLSSAKALFGQLKEKRLQGFGELATDAVRRELDHRLLAEVIGHPSPDVIDEMATALNNEPTMTARH